MSKATHGPIRVGAFIAVIGPSGAGKDTILAGARKALADDPAFVFPRRVITRAADRHEDNETSSQEAFEERRQNGDFLLWWSANRLAYGLPQSLKDDLEQGRHVIVNVSRTVVEDIRSRFARSLVIEIRADPIILIDRLARRGRESVDVQSERFRRSASLAAAPVADIVIDNNGEPEVAIRQFVRGLESLGHLTQECMET